MLLPLLQVSRTCLFHHARYANNYHLRSHLSSPFPIATRVNIHKRFYSSGASGTKNLKREDESQVDNSILLIEKSLADKTYKKFYFTREDAIKADEKPSMHHNYSFFNVLLQFIYIFNN